jgi:small subunit ribosomal protein S20
MANLKSSKKDIRRSGRKRIANQSVRTSLKTYLKKVRKAVEAADTEVTASALQTAQSKIDRAAQKGVIHKNQARRRLSRIAKKAAAAAKS